MILSPLQNKGILLTNWVQRRPHVTQNFGARPEVYKQFGMNGHNGLDFRAKTGTPLYSPIEGVIKVINQGSKGYGLHVQIDKDNLRIVLAHLSHVYVSTGDRVYFGSKIALSGNTGFSTAPHLHMTVKRLDNGEVLSSSNGFQGAVRFSHFLLSWKGTLINSNY